MSDTGSSVQEYETPVTGTGVRQEWRLRPMQTEIAQRSDSQRTILYAAITRARALEAAARARRLAEKKRGLERDLEAAIDHAYAIVGGQRGDRHLASEGMSAMRICDAAGRGDLADRVGAFGMKLANVCMERADACHVVGRSGLRLPLRAARIAITRRVPCTVTRRVTRRSSRPLATRTRPAAKSSTADPDSSSSDPPGDRASWRTITVENPPLATLVAIGGAA
jgi:hypothetical protein